MKKVSPGEKELITPAEAIEYYTLSWRKVGNLMNTKNNFTVTILLYYAGDFQGFSNIPYIAGKSHDIGLFVYYFICKLFRVAVDCAFFNRNIICIV